MVYLKKQKTKTELFQLPDRNPQIPLQPGMPE